MMASNVKTFEQHPGQISYLAIVQALKRYAHLRI